MEYMEQLNSRPVQTWVWRSPGHCLLQ